MLAAPGMPELGFATGGVGTTTSVFPPMVFVPSLSVGVANHVALEAGANLSPDQKWSMAFLGSRSSWAPMQRESSSVVIDLELGAGLGRGGRLDGYDVARRWPTGPVDGLDPTERTAFGGYGGVGVAWRYEFLAAYARARVEVTSATHVPVTFWPSAIAGVELDLWHRLRVSAAAGYVGYINASQNNHGWLYQAAVTVPFKVGDERS